MGNRVIYTLSGKLVWEINERQENLKDHSINSSGLIIKFNKNDNVEESSYSFCTVPDQNFFSSTKSSSSCYQKRLFPFDKQVTYDAIKRLLIISNFQVDHSDAPSEIISATGIQYLPHNKDEKLFIKLSISFSNTKNNTTQVNMSANFNAFEKQSTWVEAGFGRVTLPMPTPFLQDAKEWLSKGLVSPRFYLSFYDALSKLMAHEYLYNPKEVNATPKSHIDIHDMDSELFQLVGPIESKNCKSVCKAKRNNRPKALYEDENIFSELHGKPIDSKIEGSKLILDGFKNNDLISVKLFYATDRKSQETA